MSVEKIYRPVRDQFVLLRKDWELKEFPTQSTGTCFKVNKLKH